MRKTVVAGLLCLLAAGPSRAENAGFDLGRLRADAAQIFAPLPKAPVPRDAVEKARVELGQRLFFERRVSADGEVSCGRCHHAELGGADGLPKAIGVFGKVNPRNAPSIFNVSLNTSQHWRGDRVSLEDQAEKSLLGPTSFGNADLAAPMAKLSAIPDYRAAFAAAFPQEGAPITGKNWALAIAAFERTLLTRSRFDAFLEGDAKALSAAEAQGLRRFIDLGCASCHSGPGLGGDSLQKFGVAKDYAALTGVASPDRGRADVTKNDADLYVFKVPQLRNVANTAPYFHDGSTKDLSQAVKIMGEAQLGVVLSDDDASAIVAFLGALSGPPPANFLAPPPYPDARP